MILGHILIWFATGDVFCLLWDATKWSYVEVRTSGARYKLCDHKLPRGGLDGDGGIIWLDFSLVDVELIESQTWTASFPVTLVKIALRDDEALVNTSIDAVCQAFKLMLWMWYPCLVLVIWGLFQDVFSWKEPQLNGFLIGCSKKTERHCWKRMWQETSPLRTWI